MFFQIYLTIDLEEHRKLFSKVQARSSSLNHLSSEPFLNSDDLGIMFGLVSTSLSFDPRKVILFLLQHNLAGLSLKQAQSIGLCVTEQENYSVIWMCRIQCL